MLKVGLHLWPNASSWPSLRAAAIRADAAGWESLWTADHLMSSPDPMVPTLEGWTTMAALATLTRRLTVGLLVSANTLRNPGLTAKLASTLDHISQGRAILGMGAGWSSDEHRAFGISFPARRQDRVDQLDEALSIIRLLLDGEVVTRVGRYRAAEAICRPLPVQSHLPILVGGSSPALLRTVARHADIWNTRGSIDELFRRDLTLREWCADIGRDSHEIERTVLVPMVIRASVTQAAQVWSIGLARNGVDPDGYLQPLLGEPGRIADGLRPYVALGFEHFIVPLPSADDEETIDRVSEVTEALHEGPSS